MARKPSGYRLSRAAEADLEDIFAYTARTWSVRQAERYLDDLEAALTDLAARRRIGHARPDVGADYLTLIVGSHLVIYRQAGGLWIARILHAAMDIPRHLP